MDDRLEEGIRRAVGMSDLASLLAAVFRFPEDEKLASALVDGTFLADWQASWEDACGVPCDAGHVESCRVAFSCIDHAALRREYSRLFLAPGAEVPIWPYESAFLHRKAQRTDVPNLFRTRVTVDVERQMNEARVRPVHARTEPCDSMGTEFEFLAYLYASWGEALRCRAEADNAGEKVEGSPAAGSAGREAGGASMADSADEEAGDASAADVVLWQRRITSFAREHALAWLPELMDQVIAESRSEEYRCLAALGGGFLAELARDCKRFAE
ncbi:MAG TPA: molecular chaperone TorD family protein [Candidatus Aveggerthella stercoripullorum]|uniref:Molecular chaperone TorD family protein n=1 Tax=Candidatus Aveggerthella stercoripullorum TaxID=2840688 RepID=A0A9D1A0D5_9ACTN|nr:molecular chaperone TorD family protein [Candidatus Aveggerthella stercoripullorum]